jgi:uncharacterized damage-inducible protein DinB
MDEVERIRRELECAFSRGAWYGPTLLETLAGVDAGTAAAHPIAGAHSIWEIVHHIIYTQRLLLRRLSGEPVPWNHDEDWPAAPQPTKQAWRQTLDALMMGETELQTAIAGFPEARLDEPIDTHGTSAYRNLHGHAEHNAYHAGQIVLLRRMAGCPPAGG